MSAPSPTPEPCAATPRAAIQAPPDTADPAATRLAPLLSRQRKRLRSYPSRDTPPCRAPAGPVKRIPRHARLLGAANLSGASRCRFEAQLPVLFPFAALFQSIQ